MSDPQLVGPQQPISTPANLKRRHGRDRDLPEDLLRAASLRLGIMSLLYAVLWFVGVTLGHLSAHLLDPGSNRWLQLDAGDAIALASVIVSLGLFAYTRRGQRDPRFVLDLGLWYMIFTAFALSQLFHLGGGPVSGTTLPEISGLARYTDVRRNRTKYAPKDVDAGLVAASMNPLTMLIFDRNHVGSLGPWTRALLMHYPDFILVGAAVVISHVVTKLGQQVTRAREMGSYRLGELLGRGGMGEVYKATHRMLARPAAIKLIRPECWARSTRKQQSRGNAISTRGRSAANRESRTPSSSTLRGDEDGTLTRHGFLEGMDLETLVERTAAVRGW